jgi:hypothetical protein
MKRLYYIKEGRRYKPVAEYDSDLMDSFPKGTHIVMCYPGGQSRRYGIDPAYAPMIAAGRVAEDAIARAIHAESEARPKERPITKRQRAAWEEMKAAFGDEFFSLTFSSTRDLAEAGVKAMMEEQEKLLKNPTVRKAYEKFLLVAELTKEGRETENV